MTVFEHPPWNAASGETSAVNPLEFNACQQVINAFSDKLNGKICEHSYSLSRRWGKIVRAKIAHEDGQSTGTMSVICWSNPRVQIAVMVDGCCGG